MATPKYSTWGDPDAPGYYRDNVVLVDFMGRRIPWHRWAVAPLKAVEQALGEAGVSYRFRDVQTHSNRTKKYSRTKSYHAWPLALDINPAQNPCNWGGPLITDIPADVVAAFETRGFTWGGRWRHPVDAMHFQYDGPPVKRDAGDVAGPVLTQGMRGHEVGQAQKLLVGYGYDLVVDEDFGPKTAAAARSFQASLGLEADAAVGPSTWLALRAGDPGRTLALRQPHLRGHDVRWVQEVLVAAGAALEADGYFGHVTDAAVRQFQEANGLEPDGIVGPRTWRALRRRSCEGA
jgi:hypothetical protein